MDTTTQKQNSTFKKALKIIRKYKPEEIIVDEGKIRVKNLQCFRCGNPIYVEPASISMEQPCGVIWLCNVCGEVTEKGVPARMIEQAWSEDEPCFPTDHRDDIPF